MIPRLSNSGPWVQVSRLGMPLVNEVVIPLRDKDRFNASEPENDAQFGKYVLDPEPARLIPVLYPVFSCFPTAPRNDLAAIFLTGLDVLGTKPAVLPFPPFFPGLAPETLRLRWRSLPSALLGARL